MNIAIHFLSLHLGAWGQSIRCAWNTAKASGELKHFPRLLAERRSLRAQCWAQVLETKDRFPDLEATIEEWQLPDYDIVQLCKGLALADPAWATANGVWESMMECRIRSSGGALTELRKDENGFLVSSGVQGLPAVDVEYDDYGLVDPGDPSTWDNQTNKFPELAPGD